MSDDLDLDDFFNAVKKGDIEMVKKCLELGMDSSDWDGDRWSLLHLAVENRHLEIVKLLCEHKADVNYANEFKRTYETPLHFAVKENHTEICKVLIKYGANVNCQNHDKKIPLVYAANKRNLELCKELVKNGSDLNLRTINGKYPVEYALGEAKEFLLMFQNKKEEEEKSKQGNEKKQEGNEKQDGNEKDNKGKEKEKKEIPSNILCGLTNEIMKDPVDLKDGHIYERSVIEEWLESNNVSPITGEILTDKTLIPNQSIKLLCQKWII